MPTAPYDTLETVVTMARVRLNDAIQSINGEVLTDTAGFTLYVINVAWRRLQQLLVNYNTSIFQLETALSNVPAFVGTDQGVRVWFNFVNYFDGNALQTAPVFPQNFISPLSLWERVHGGTGNYFPMDQVVNGLPTTTRKSLNGLWEWRGETIYMPGATGTTDILMQYCGFLADFVAPGTTAFSLQPVPIMRCADPFAWFIVSEMARSRGDMDAGAFDALAMDATDFMFNRDPLRAKSIDKESEYGKMVNRYTPTKGASGPRGGNA